MPGRLISIGLLTLLSACARLTISSQTESPESLALAPPLNLSRRIVQQVHSEWAGRRDVYLCVLELTKQRITIAGLTQDGLSLFNVNYDGNKVDMAKSLLLPPQIKPENIIQDMQLAFWPQNELQQILPAAWRLYSSQGKRQYYVNDELSVEVHYGQNTLPSGQNWPASVVLTNHRYHYRLTINTISNEALSQ